MATLRELAREELTELVQARQARLAALREILDRAPATAETRFQRRLLARAAYSLWLDQEALAAPTAAAR